MDHAAHHGYGRGAHRMVRLHTARAWRAFAASANSHAYSDEPAHARMAGPNPRGSEIHLDRRADRARPFSPSHEWSGVTGAGLPRNRASKTAQPEKSCLRHFYLQHGVHFARFLLRGNDYSRPSAAAIF